MKKLWIAMSVVAVLVTGSISYSLANGEMDEFEKGTEFAKIYQQTIEKYTKRESVKSQLTDDINQEEVAEKIAQYRAFSKTFGGNATEEQAIEKVKERKLVADYAKKNDIYPTEEEILNHIGEQVKDYHEIGSELVAGMIKEFGITEEEFFYEFSRPGYEEELVRLNILEKLKSENSKRKDENEQMYHNRMLDELKDLINEMK